MSDKELNQTLFAIARSTGFRRDTRLLLQTLDNLTETRKRLDRALQKSIYGEEKGKKK